MALPSMTGEQLHTMVLELDQALYNHERWAETLFGTLISQSAPDARDLDPEAHRHCRFGQWCYDEAAAVLGDHAAFIEIEAEHGRMHNFAAQLLESVRDGRTPTLDDYERFLSAMKLLRLEIATLRHDLVDALGNLDPLTGAPNRIAMLTWLRALHPLIKRGAHVCAIALLEPDNFKSVNDRYGASVGDKVLVSFAQHIPAHLTPLDRVFRHGGEKFLIALMDADVATARQVTERLRQALGVVAHRGTDGTFHVSVSLGLTALDPTALVEKSIDRADRALYAAKAAGHDRVMAWEEVADTFKPASAA